MTSPEALNAFITHPLFLHSGDAMLLLDANGIIRHSNDPCKKLTGYDHEQLNQRPLASLLEEDSAQGLTDFIVNLLKEDKADEMQADLHHRNGHRLKLQLRGIPFALQEQSRVYVVMRDVTDQKLSAQLIEHMAYHDTLTGLPNRTLFHIQLTQALGTASGEVAPTPFAIMMIGLERFQLVNDSLGHSWGDLLLKQVSERLRQTLGTRDLISRIGNYEFAILFYGFTDPSDMVEQARRIQSELMEPYWVQDRELVISSSIGLAFYPQDGSEMNRLMRHAAKALSSEKEKGQGLFRIEEEEADANSLQRLELENDLRKAVNREELELHYQPQYDIRDMRLIGMEALIRWRHPRLGLIAPAQFIPLAEETGLIVPIGDWVIRTACWQNKRWQDAGLPPLTVSVNLSLRQFHKHNLIGDILQILKETGLHPSYLELEITESMAMHNVERVIRKLHELKNFGIRISMDDFGTGYSSLHYLKKIPIHKLKIDQSFIRDITSDPDSAAIVATIIAMANHLKLDVVAEGVETEGDLRFLSEQNCPHAQGYYFSKPLPAAEFESVLRKLNEPLV